MKIQSQIEQKLQAELAPSHLQVVNESHMHSVPANSETHFNVVVASDQFSGKRQVQRHQAIYAILADELAGELTGKIHALALHTYTPQEWAEHIRAENKVPQSPDCMGGSKRG